MVIFHSAVVGGNEQKLQEQFDEGEKINTRTEELRSGQEQRYVSFIPQ